MRDIQTIFAPRTTGPILLCGAVLLLGGCSPTVRLEVPDRPIVINLNVKIEQEVRVKLEKGVEEAIQSNPKIF